MNTAKQRVCKSCGSNYKNSIVHESPVNCPKCYRSHEDRLRKLKSMTLGQMSSSISVAGKHPSWLFSNVRNLNRSWNADLRKLSCANCGYSNHVELAHRKPLSSFPMSATLAEVNARENNVQLCPNCHWEFDNGLLILVNVVVRS